MPGTLAIVEALEEYLALGALANRPIDEMVAGFTSRAHAGGLSVARVMMGWRLLDPLYMSQALVYTEAAGLSCERFRHGEAMTSPDFLNSPVWHILNEDITEMRQRIDGANEAFPFPLLDHLRDEGYSDYLIVKVGFGSSGALQSRPGGGVVVSFASDRPGGFRDEEIAALSRLKYMVALAVRTIMEADMRATLATTYLGHGPGEKVLAGQIARGEGEAIDAVIWYCDLRSSTELCEAMGVAQYLPMLNDYFGAVAEPVIAEGGQILDFIGDAVLAIFPLEGDAIARAQRATAAALDNLAGFRGRHPNIAARGDATAIAGIAIATGTVVYGNIGIPTRLTFSVIGPTVNEVARIERLTKQLREPVLVTAPIAEAAPDLWRQRGAYALEGVTDTVALYAPEPGRWNQPSPPG